MFKFKNDIEKKWYRISDNGVVLEVYDSKPRGVVTYPIGFPETELTAGEKQKLFPSIGVFVKVTRTENEGVVTYGYDVIPKDTKVDGEDVKHVKYSDYYRETFEIGDEGNEQKLPFDVFDLGKIDTDDFKSADYPYAYRLNEEPYTEITQAAYDALQNDEQEKYEQINVDFKYAIFCIDIYPTGLIGEGDRLKTYDGTEKTYVDFKPAGKDGVTYDDVCKSTAFRHHDDSEGEGVFYKGTVQGYLNKVIKSVCDDVIEGVVNGRDINDVYGNLPTWMDFLGKGQRVAIKFTTEDVLSGSIIDKQTNVFPIVLSENEGAKNILSRFLLQIMFGASGNRTQASNTCLQSDIIKPWLFFYGLCVQLNKCVNSIAPQNSESVFVNYKGEGGNGYKMCFSDTKEVCVQKNGTPAEMMLYANSKALFGCDEESTPVEPPSQTGSEGALTEPDHPTTGEPTTGEPGQLGPNNG